MASLKIFNTNGEISKSRPNFFESSLNKIQLLDNNFSLQVNTDNVKMLEAYDAIQQGVVYLKTDMLSLMSISVDYMDADGD